MLLRGLTLKTYSFFTHNFNSLFFKSFREMGPETKSMINYYVYIMYNSCTLSNCQILSNYYKTEKMSNKIF